MVDTKVKRESKASRFRFARAFDRQDRPPAEVHKIKDAVLCVDGVAYSPHRHLDMQDLGVDFYCFSWYKVYGPHIAMLYASPLGMSTTKSLGHYFNPHATLQHKLGLAGSSYELTAAIPAVVAYIGASPKETWSAIEKHEGELQTLLLDYLNSRKDVTIYGEKSADTKLRVATISFTVAGWKSKDVVDKVEELSNGEMAIRWGGMYSVRLLEDVLGLGYDGVVRVSMVHYNTGEYILFTLDNRFSLTSRSG
ncbi:putative cysteine desulfurase [Glarea lozoyensis 74030]|uniref:Putative cysteine desulfurase n=1 Tax=Glarea lozoyensis (strain ATCC 74030 / MF5533) TaxID=1104152 RepID=H0ERK7_GLAL7|nr:putative cysteine desulfurase [Glarea lozoyensis 74030]